MEKNSHQIFGKKKKKITIERSNIRWIKSKKMNRKTPEKKRDRERFHTTYFFREEEEEVGCSV